MSGQVSLSLRVLEFKRDSMGKSNSLCFEIMQSGLTPFLAIKYILSMTYIIHSDVVQTQAICRFLFTLRICVLNLERVWFIQYPELRDPTHRGFTVYRNLHVSNLVCIYRVAR